MVYMFKSQPELYDIAFRDKFLDSRDPEVLVVNSGGDSGPCAFVLIPYTESGPVPVTTPVAQIKSTIQRRIELKQQKSTFVTHSEGTVIKTTRGDESSEPGNHLSGNLGSRIVGRGSSTISLSASVSEVDDYDAGHAFFLEQGWTDGNPIVLPTEDKVRSVVQALGRDPREIVARSRERNRSITVEQVAINSVMAGCTAREVPVVIAAIQSMLTERFCHNYTASVGGPWPFFIVSGPIVSEIGLNYDQYVLGPGGRANSVIARAVSLVCWNCLDQRPGGVQRGAFGPAWRNECILPERPDCPWSQLNEDRGYSRDTSTITAFPATGYEQVLVHLLDTPEHILAPIVDSLSTGRFIWGPYVLVLPPNMVAVFVEAGWTKTRIIEYVFENTKRSVAGLKLRTRWAEQQPGPWSDLLEVKEGDRESMVYMFKSQPELYDIAFRDKFLDSRDPEVLVVNSGGDSGPCAYVLIPNTESGPVPVTTPVAQLKSAI
jgi:hypothetical protein